MKTRILSTLFTFIWGALLFSGCSKHDTPLGLNPDNPHYFLFRGKPAVLIGSTEHYGAVLNLDFNYTKYLDALAARGLNVTRTFSGIYREPYGAFGIEENSMAPASERFICPWARSSQPGYADGGNKFDLNQWDEPYFTRLKDFVSQAGKRGIVVELDLFTNFYDSVKWKLSPLYIGNNINGIGNFSDEKEVLSLQHPDILAVQTKMVQKIVAELKDFDNLYYEVCNEPYFGNLDTLQKWETYMTGVIAGAEKEFRYKHLISQNIANGSQKVSPPDPRVSLFNFHYAHPPTTVEINYDLNKAIGDNETGFNGTADLNYRKEAWNFMVAGGALFDNLDYSFTVGHEDGNFHYPPTQPGGGSDSLRSQLSLLKHIMDGLDIIHMKPANDCIKNIVKGSVIRVLANPGKQYLIYLSRDNGQLCPCALSLELPAGDYSCTWINPVSGERKITVLKAFPGGVKSWVSPPYRNDLAFTIFKK